MPNGKKKCLIRKKSVGHGEHLLFTQDYVSHVRKKNSGNFLNVNQLFPAKPRWGKKIYEVAFQFSYAPDVTRRFPMFDPLSRSKV